MNDRQRLRRLTITVICLLLTTLPSLAALQTGQEPAAQPIQPRHDAHVIMISIDGLVPDYYLEPAQIGLRVPNLVRMKLEGAYAGGVEGIYPTVTYPAHTTLI